MRLLQRIYEAFRPRKPKREPQTHDYTRARWGHSLSFCPLNGGAYKGYLFGYGKGVCAGDYLLLRFPLREDSGEVVFAVTRYEIEAVAYECDPPDRWFALAHYAPAGPWHERIIEPYSMAVPRRRVPTKSFGAR